jgi:peptide methionine sulfoxide reductase msrA/msrB
MEKSDEEWKHKLSPEQYNILRKKGTEAPFCGLYWNNKKPGKYVCAACGSPLFESKAKFESHTGWPSFFSPISKKSVRFLKDRELGMTRTEVQCAKCGGHLGHVFNDGPPPTGQRYCINSGAMRFEEKLPPLAKATFAAGCFWGVEMEFSKVPGVKKTMVGYTGGAKKNPTYEEVCTDKTGHAEAVQVEYDPKEVGFDKLLEIFWKSHNPTTPNRQGPDFGTQYRSAIFYHDRKQMLAARKSMEMQQKKLGARKIVTEIAKATKFYPAEEYHQKYLEKRNIGSCHI